ncbi:unnamed protein product [Cochlearia groenlandica]
MRFRKGSKVEVFSNKETPYGAWRCAEIISGNGHTYNVRYNSFQLAHYEEAVTVTERVQRKIIRPCPPQVAVERWGAGDLVEVLENFCWKAATVREELCGKYYVVRLLGTLADYTLHKVSLRVRQSWEDERWVAIGKVSGSMKSSTLTGSEVHQKLQNGKLIREPSVVSARILKRPSPFNLSECAESCTGNPKKRRSMEKEGQKQQFHASIEKVGLKFQAKSSLKDHKTGWSQMVKVSSKGYNSESVRPGSLVADDCYDSDTCSVGSCSAASYESNMPPCMLDQEEDSCGSDAESSCGLGEEAKQIHTSENNGARRSCRSDLYSYRSTLGKLFAYGPLSWEQEASLTDLRLSLNISDDEHLMEVKSLISTGTRSQFC